MVKSDLWSGLFKAIFRLKAMYLHQNITGFTSTLRQKTSNQPSVITSKHISEAVSRIRFFWVREENISYEAIYAVLHWESIGKSLNAFLRPVIQQISYIFAFFQWCIRNWFYVTFFFFSWRSGIIFIAKNGIKISCHLPIRMVLYKVKLTLPFRLSVWFCFLLIFYTSTPRRKASWRSWNTRPCS